MLERTVGKGLWRRFRIPIAILLLFFSGVGVCQAAPNTCTLSISVPSPGNWEVYGSMEGEGRGLATFIIDVTGTDGLGVTSSVNRSPRYWDPTGGIYGTGAFVGFANQRTNGNNGIGIYAGQFTGYGGPHDPVQDALIIQNVGILPGSFGSVSWAAPVRFASGTYSGTDGYLHVTVGSGGFVYLKSVDDGPWVGPGNCDTLYNVFGADYYVPEPGVLLLLLPALALRAKARRRPA